MTPIELQHLYELPKKYGIYDFDVKSLIDTSLSYAENKNIILNELKRLGRISESGMTEQIEKSERQFESELEWRVRNIVEEEISDLLDKVDKLESELGKIEEIKREVERSKIPKKIEAWLYAGPGGYQYFSQYLTTLWNKLIDVRYKLKSGVKSDKIKQMFLQLVDEIERVSNIVSGTDLEERARMLLRTAKDTKKYL